MSKLKPCPFCGCEYSKDDDDYYYSGEHERSCPLWKEGLIVPDLKNAIESWNTRAEQTCELERLISEAFWLAHSLWCKVPLENLTKEEARKLDEMREYLGIEVEP